MACQPFDIVHRENATFFSQQPGNEAMICADAHYSVAHRFGQNFWPPLGVPGGQHQDMSLLVPGHDFMERHCPKKSYLIVQSKVGGQRFKVRGFWSIANYSYPKTQTFFLN